MPRTSGRQIRNVRGETERPTLHLRVIYSHQWYIVCFDIRRKHIEAHVDDAETGFPPLERYTRNVDQLSEQAA